MKYECPNCGKINQNPLVVETRKKNYYFCNKKCEEEHELDLLLEDYVLTNLLFNPIWQIKMILGKNPLKSFKKVK